MAKKLYVGNLSYSTTDESLKAFFEQAGEVEEAVVIKDRNNPDRSRGFGFVTMKTEEGAKKAVETLNGQELDGRQIRVNEARSREEGSRPGAPSAE